MSFADEPPEYRPAGRTVDRLISGAIMEAETDERMSFQEEPDHPTILLNKELWDLIAISENGKLCRLHRIVDGNVHDFRTEEVRNIQRLTDIDVENIEQEQYDREEISRRGVMAMVGTSVTVGMACGIAKSIQWMFSRRRSSR